MTGASHTARLGRGGGHFGPALVGYLVVAALVGVALAFYFVDAHTNTAPLRGPLSGRGDGFVIGEAAGIAAAVLLPIAVILASRVKALEYLFGDLTSVYVAHGVIGLTMFALVSFHPIMYLLGGLMIPTDFLTSAHVLVPFHVVALDWVSYIAIAIALVTTMYLSLSFWNWRLTHLLLGLAMIVTGYSILIENSGFDTAAIPGLRYLLFALYGLGTIAFLWVAVFRRFAEPKREYRIVDAKFHEAANAIELRAEPVGKPAKFEPGQFTYVDLLDSAKQVHREFEAHPFSIASAPGSRTLSLVIETTGSHTSRMKEIAAADDARALLHGSYGRLVARFPKNKKQLWIAGGIGITPFMAMAEDMALRPDEYEGYHVRLVVGVDHPDQAFELDRLLEYERKCPGLEVRVWNRSEQGLPTAETIQERVPDVTERAVMISGPDPMIHDLSEQFLALGIPRGHLRVERQIGPPKVWRKTSPSLRRARTVTTVFFASFVALVVVSVFGRLFFA